jgi:spore photoproduct lyase
VERRNLKSLLIKPSGRSSDYIAPSFATGCILECLYCYMKRNTPHGVTFYDNVDEILLAIDKHSKALKNLGLDAKPNQTDERYITYDISCNEDFALHLPNHQWEKIFTFFKQHRVAKATLATKIIPKKLLSFNPKGKVRIRFSLMPQRLSNILEPKSALIIERIKAINTFIEAGYDVHINYSPVVLYVGWETDYVELFKLVDNNVKKEYKEQVKAEVIFLTHNRKKHFDNLGIDAKAEQLLYIPHLQEEKTSQYGGINLRYKAHIKAIEIEKFRELHRRVIPWNTIRYIF